MQIKVTFPYTHTIIITTRDTINKKIVSKRRKGDSDDDTHHHHPSISAKAPPLPPLSICQFLSV